MPYIMGMETIKEMNTKIHVFEKAGLGKAPFRVVGYEFKTYQACPDAPAQVGGSCEYCWTGIKDTFHIESADGQHFVVGSTCVNKTGDKGLIDATKRQLNAAKAQRTAERNQERIDAALKELKKEDIREKLADIPHEQGWAAGEGMTMLDWAEWMMKHAGMSGMMRVVRYIDRLKSC